MGIYDNFRLRIWGRLQFQGEVSRSWSYSSWLVMKGLDPKRVPARRSCVMVWGHPLPVTWMLVDNARFFYCYVRSAWHIFRHLVWVRPKDQKKSTAMAGNFCLFYWDSLKKPPVPWDEARSTESTQMSQSARGKTIDHSSNWRKKDSRPFKQPIH